MRKFIALTILGMKYSQFMVMQGYSCNVEVVFVYFRLMVTVSKQDTIGELKAAICDLLDNSIERDLLVTAEVKGGCISRPLVGLLVSMLVV